MLKKLSILAALCVVVLITGCSVNVTQPANTTAKAENDLTALTVNINGIPTNLDAIDLYNVHIGDATFQYVEGGTITPAQVVSSPNPVTISVDSAVGYVGGQGMYLFTNISPSTVDLSAGITNIIPFSGSSFVFGNVSIQGTKIQVENDLASFSAGGIPIDYIDLVGITVGDVYFSSVDGGDISPCTGNQQFRPCIRNSRFRVCGGKNLGGERQCVRAWKHRPDNGHNHYSGNYEPSCDRSIRSSHNPPGT